MNLNLIINDNDFNDFLDLLKQLIRVPSVTGAEHSFLLYLKRELDELGIKTEHYDGLLVASGKDPTNGILSAHIDRHGVICTGPNEFQFAAFLAKNRSDLRGDSLSEQMFQLISKRYINQNVHAYEPFSGGYLGMGKITNAFLKEEINNLIFEIEGFNNILPSTPIAFVDKLKQKDNLLSAQLDNVLSAAIIIYLYQHGFSGTAFFTAQEEAGKSWRFIHEWFKKNKISTNRLIVLDTSPYETREEADKQLIVLRNKDVNAKFKSPLLKELKKFCVKNKISYSYKDEFIKEKNIARVEQGLKPLSIGSTELGRIIQASNGNIQGTTLQIPTTGYHTVDETANILSIKAMIFILSKFYIKIAK